MLNVVKAELRKMKRPSLLYVNVGILTGLSVLFTSLVFLRTGSQVGDRRHGSEMAQTVASLSKFDGGYFTFGLMSLFLGLISLTVFASQSSNEYSYGTLRNLLVRQPSRMKLLGGKLLAMAAFAFLLVTFVAIVNIGLSYAESGHGHVDTALWSSTKAIHAFLTLYGNTLLATIGYGLVGMSLGIILKSPMSAISISLLWFMVLENILGAVLPSSTKWLPGNALSSISAGGAKIFSYQRGLLTSAVYLLLFGGLATALFKRRDVAS
jgi:ABC-type transport system involved in multi-copper enzyme maturation permease subunit